MELAEPARGYRRGLAGMEEREHASARAEGRDGERRKRPRRRSAPRRIRPGRSRRRASAPPAAARRSASRRGPARTARSRRCRRRRSPWQPRRALRPASCAGSPALRSSGPAAGCACGSGSVATRLQVYASLNPAPTRTSSTSRRSRCSLVRWPATARRSGIVVGTRSRTTRATSSTTSISRLTSRARHVGTVTSHCVGDTEAEPLENRALLVAADREPDDPVGPFRPEPDEGPLGQLAVDIGGTGQLCAARSTISRLARIAAGSARYGSTPFSQRFDPSVRRPSRSDVRKIPIGSKFAASSNTSLVSGVTSLSAPPMIAARATGFSPSVISRSPSSTRRSVPSRVVTSSPAPA